MEKSKRTNDSKSSNFIDPELLTFGLTSLFLVLYGHSFLVEESERCNEGYCPRIRQGWFNGRKMDKSDDQWLEWRENFLALCTFMAAFLSLSNLIKYKMENFPRERRFQVQIVSYNVFSFLFVTYVHGSYAIFPFALASLSYLITWIPFPKAVPWITWIFNFSCLIGCYYFHFRFRDIPALAFLDDFKGLVSWDTYFKISILRLISFNMDHYWTNQKRTSSYKATGNDYLRVQELNLPLQDYNFSNFFAYVFYPPFFIAGPVASFNAFIWQIYQPQKNYSTFQIIWGFIRVFFWTLVFEISIHYCYAYSFNETGYALEHFQGVKLGLVGFFVLNYMYLKFTIIWRFFRLCGLADGIETPENMNRCVCNNFTFTGFWRSWHGSLNIWIVRYLYVPLGGSKTRLLSMWLIFFFIGVWHDLWWRWIAWALLNCVFFSLEILLVSYFQKKFAWFLDKSYSRFFVAAMGGLNIHLLVCANLAIPYGFDNTPIFLGNVFFGTDGLWAFFCSWLTFTFGAATALRYRKLEELNNKSKKF